MSGVIPLTPSKSICSKLGHSLMKGSKSLSHIPRSAVRNNFFSLGQPAARADKLSRGNVKPKLQHN